MLQITYQAARELLLWLSQDLSSGTARASGESESCGITLQGRSPLPAGQLGRPPQPTEPRFLLDTTTAALPSGLGKVCARARPTEDASSTCVSFLDHVESCPLGTSTWESRRGKGWTSEKLHGPLLPRGQTTVAHVTSLGKAPTYEWSNLGRVVSPSSVSVSSPVCGDSDRRHEGWLWAHTECGSKGTCG